MWLYSREADGALRYLLVSILPSVASLPALVVIVLHLHIRNCRRGFWSRGRLVKAAGLWLKSADSVLGRYPGGCWMLGRHHVGC
jgi:hypothetical protein